MEENPLRPRGQKPDEKCKKQKGERNKKSRQRGGEGERERERRGEIETAVCQRDDVICAKLLRESAAAVTRNE